MNKKCIQKEKFPFECSLQEYTYRKNLLKAILLSSVSEKNCKFPTIEGFILCELVNGVIEYIGGNAGLASYQSFPSRECALDELYTYLRQEIDNKETGLAPKVKEALLSMCEPYWASDWDGSHANTQLYDFICGVGDRGIRKVSRMEETFTLSQGITIKLEKEFFPKLSGQEKKDIQGIGKAMRKYIDKDLEYIAHTYYW